MTEHSELIARLQMSGIHADLYKDVAAALREQAGEWEEAKRIAIFQDKRLAEQVGEIVELTDSVDFYRNESDAHCNERIKLSVALSNMTDERDTLNGVNDQLRTQLGLGADENARLASENAGLRKDAERYRFLRDTAPWNSPVVVIDTPEAPDDVPLYCKEQLDSAIDAAMEPK